MRHLIKTERAPGRPFRITIAKPFLDNRVAAEFIRPHRLRNIAYPDTVVHVQITRATLTDVVVDISSRNPSTFPAAEVGVGDDEVRFFNGATVDGFELTERRIPLPDYLADAFGTIPERIEQARDLIPEGDKILTYGNLLRNR